MSPRRQPHARTLENLSNWATWTLIWNEAVQAQAKRILEGEFMASQPDSMLFADALRNVLRGGVAVFGVDSKPVLAFLREVPDAVEVRDIFEHFDDYVAGEGDLQRTGRLGRDQWFPLHTKAGDGFHSVVFGEFRLEIATARHASSELTEAAQRAAEQARMET